VMSRRERDDQDGVVRVVHGHVVDQDDEAQHVLAGLGEHVIDRCPCVRVVVDGPDVGEFVGFLGPKDDVRRRTGVCARVVRPRRLRLPAGLHRTAVVARRPKRRIHGGLHLLISSSRRGM
jgi:hypothetical protein